MIISSGCGTSANGETGSKTDSFPDPVAELARRDFSIPYLYPIQRLVIANVLEGASQLVVLPTGAGKSLCFQLPARLLAGLTVVVVPLLALMEDQLQGLRARGLPAGALRGGQTAAQREELLRRAGPQVPAVERVRLLYVTPEGLASPGILGRLRAAGVEHLVIDEAHCVSEWGRSFRPAYLALAQVLPALAPRTVSAFTATATPEVTREVERVLFDGRPHHTVLGHPDRPNIHYRVLPVISRLHALDRLVREAAPPVLVFGRSRDGVRALARALARRAGREVRFYHAGLTAAERAAVEAWFLASRDGVLVATSAYGLGVDKPDIRTVVHAEVPYSIEAYLQESGRAGRDGQPARAVLLCGPQDEAFLAALTGGLERDRYRRILLYARGADRAGSRCRRRFLLAALGAEEPGGDGTACAGCDVCDGTAVERPEGEAEVLRFVRRHRRLYNLRELGQILAGRPCYEGVRKGLDRSPGFGLLVDWDPEDIAEGLRTMLESGRLTVLPRGFWKDRVTAGGDVPWKPSSSEFSRSTGAAAGA